jgi:hypothetical protein
MTEREENAGRDAPVEPGGGTLPGDQSTDQPNHGLGDVPTEGSDHQETPSGGPASSGTSSGQP